MKRFILGIAALTIFGFVVSQALAWNGDMQNGYGPMMGKMDSAMSSNVDYSQGWRNAQGTQPARAELGQHESIPNPDMKRMRALEHRRPKHNGYGHGKGFGPGRAGYGHAYQNWQRGNGCCW